MSEPPLLFDRTALNLHRARATAQTDADRFVHAIARTEIKERLTEVNRTFTNPAFVGPFAAEWSGFGKSVPDEDPLDLVAASHDLVVHAMALHWANDPVGQLIQCRRALRPDGLFLGVFFGGQTLHELRSVIATAEVEVMGGLSPRVAPMGDIRDLGALLGRAGLALPVADSLTVPVTYGSIAALVQDLRAMGETNALTDRLRQPMHRSLWERVETLYHQTFATDDGRLPATYELIFLTGWAPAPTQPKPLRPGSAAQRLAEALNTTEHSTEHRTKD